MAKSPPGVENGAVEGTSKRTLSIETEAVAGNTLELGATCDSSLALYLSGHVAHLVSSCSPIPARYSVCISPRQVPIFKINRQY